MDVLILGALRLGVYIRASDFSGSSDTRIRRGARFVKLLGMYAGHRDRRADLFFF